MAKRKRKPGQKSTIHFKPAKNYRTDKYIIYVHNIEKSILIASKIKPGTTVNDVHLALQHLLKQLQQPEGYETLFRQKTADKKLPETASNIIITLIIKNLKRLFADVPPLNAEDLIGVLRVIRSSVKFWSKEDRARGYLRFLEDFMAQTGVNIYKLTKEELKLLDSDSFK